jgi:dolichol-phosphate mannosyltransferase
MPQQSMPKITVVFPAYNEAGAIARVLDETHALFSKQGFGKLELVVVDDGSKDDTVGVVRRSAQKLPVTLIEHGKNRGLGGALSTGMLAAAGASAPDDIVLTTESDGTQPASKLVELAQAIRAGADFAVATPLTGEGFEGVPFYRRVLSRGANLLYGLLFPVRGLHDYTNLVRGFRASLLQRGIAAYGPERFIDQRGFEAVPDILLKLRRFKPRVAEVGLKIDFTQMERDSSMDVLHTIRRSLLLCLRHLAGQARPRAEVGS